MRKAMIITTVIAILSGLCAAITVLLINHGETVYGGYALKDRLNEEHDPRFYPIDDDDDPLDFGDEDGDVF